MSASLLDGCTIVLSGTFKGSKHGKLTHDALRSMPSDHQPENINNQIEANGGTTASAVDGTITHLIASQADFDKDKPKGK